MPEQHGTRRRCIYDAEHRTLTAIQDGVGGISVVNLPLGDVLAALPIAVVEHPKRRRWFGRAA